MGNKRPIIETQRLRLRPFRVSDTDELLKMFKSKDIQNHISQARYQQNRSDCLQLVAEEYANCDFENNFFFAIEEKFSHKMVGAILCRLVHDFDTEFFIYDYYRNEGFMHEALAAFIDFMSKGGALLFQVNRHNGPGMAIIQKIVDIQDITALYEPSDHNLLYFRRIL